MPVDDVESFFAELVECKDCSEDTVADLFERAFSSLLNCEGQFTNTVEFWFDLVGCSVCGKVFNFRKHKLGGSEEVAAEVENGYFMKFDDDIVGWQDWEVE